MFASQHDIPLRSPSHGSKSDESGDEGGESALRIGFRGWRCGALAICLLLLVGCLAVLSHAAYLGLQLAAIAAPEPLPKIPNVRADACPCECQQGVNDEVQSMPQPQTCKVGKSCLFGQGWCSLEAPLSAQVSEPQLGSCLKQKCGGPQETLTFQSTCSRTHQVPFDVSAFLHGFPGFVKQKLQDASFVNKLLAGLLEEHGMHVLSVSVDEELIEGLSMQLDHLSVVWLLGCWPASRYAIVSGSLNLPRGKITIRFAGFEVTILPSLLVTFSDLRVELSCPGGMFVIEGFGDAKSGAVKPNSIVAEGGLNIQCEGGWGIYCRALRTLGPTIVERIGQLSLSLLDSARGYNIAPGCGILFRNVFAVLPYREKECCEGAYQVDHAGCLIGGQFNGKFVPGQSRSWAAGIECKRRDDTGSYVADCQSVPASYVEQSPGICREADEARSWPHGMSMETVLSDMQSLIQAERSVCVACVLLFMLLFFPCMLLVPVVLTYSNGYQTL